MNEPNTGDIPMHDAGIPSPCFILEEKKLKKNLELLQYVQEQAGVDIILALKGFAMWHTFPLVTKYLHGASAGSLHEARLCHEFTRKAAHTYAVAYKPEEVEEMASLSSHMTFNSFSQWHRFKSLIPDSVSCGLRINPQWSDVAADLYNPADAASRLGITQPHFKAGLPKGIEGIHFHVLCESDSHALEQVLQEVERRFGHLLKEASWLNVGGGHLMTEQGYDIAHLISLLTDFRKKHHLSIIMEPGSAVAWQAGVLRATILDIVENGALKTIIPDISFTCHMPDCLEMPYLPRITGAKAVGNSDSGYSIGGVSCLAGDFILAYQFERQPRIGDHLIFEDMIHYTMVKTTTFNGLQHPAIGIWKENDTFLLVKQFGYDDYKAKLS